ncbi:FAD-containing monooxygenase-like protein [Hapsidospora chrysogenum ATCC 11550]|uniref:FAD-containing monooxygenase-like protein n=1 Tax=Hapsidospora chrysogenum (strain ATCC 11550 / CBS 779.69 / DSM 880 / IAM 14645 / JCM 23072 / IMI 49137) TaxID=857340 RepID=A0A086T4E3_HAPC1|nr:FAD-containing monooxygenase-like protein [Hapsidospora chrysogenum ATCC 11550]
MASDEKTHLLITAEHGGDVRYVDTVIVGAGISGINAAYRIQTQAPKDMSYVILEGRDSLGGTWDLFRYPGIRSDSDIFTFGFPWSPWTRNESLPAGDHIKEYMTRSVQEHGIDHHICYRHSVTSANWISSDKCWELEVKVSGRGDKGEEKEPTTVFYRCRFILLGTGYYDYETPLQTVIPGIENFEGRVIHPQFWPEDFDYTNKHVVIIGSGATAVTILPSMADRAKRVTMLQRSPGYIFPLPSRSFISNLLFILLPASIAHFLNRMIWLFRSHVTTWFCRLFPRLAKALVRQITVRNLPPDIKWDPNFKPRYNPWEQRFCASMDGDFFAALRSGKGDVVTDKIRTITKDSIELESGANPPLKPDVIVTATGLKLRFGGGIRFALDGEPLSLADKFAWKSAMLQDTPNLLFMTGYETASWTLGADVSVQLFLRLLRWMDSKGATVAVPRVRDTMAQKPMMSLSSTYLKNAMQILPKGGTGQWTPKKNYFVDMADAKWGDIVTDLELM